MKNIFVGRKKYLTIPGAIFTCLFFLPLTIIALIAWFTKSKISSAKIKTVIYSVLVVTALPFAVGYSMVFRSPHINSESLTKKYDSSLIDAKQSETTPIPPVTPLATSLPTIIATVAPQAEMTTIIKKATATPAVTATPTSRPKVKPSVAPTISPSTSSPYYANVGAYRCDCSKTCTQISSCSEAQYQLNTCGCAQRDNDHDGIACDSAPLHCQN